MPWREARRPKVRSPEAMWAEVVEATAGALQLDARPAARMTTARTSQTGDARGDATSAHPER